MAQAQCSGEPTTQETSVQATQLTNTSMNVTWSSDSDANSYILVVKKGSAISWTPDDGISYFNDTAGGNFANALDQGDGNKVMFVGSGNSTIVKDLMPDDPYYFQVFTYCDASWDYKTTPGSTNDGTQNLTLNASYCTPSAAISENLITSVQLNNVTETTSQTSGGYTDNTTTEIELYQSKTYTLELEVEATNDSTATVKVWIDWNKNGNFNDTDEAYDVGSVSAGQTETISIDIDVPSENKLDITRMRIAAQSTSSTDFDTCNSIERGEFEDYNIKVLNRFTSEINAPTTQVAGLTIKPDTVSTTQNQFDVFKFTMSDESAGDTLPTVVSQLRLQAGAQNTADWNTQIADVVFNDGTDDIPGTATINSGEILFDPDTPIEIADDSSLDITTKIYLNNGGIQDGKLLEFEIPADAQFVVSNDNSNGFTNPLTNGAITSELFTIDVQALKLVL